MHRRVLAVVALLAAAPAASAQEHVHSSHDAADHHPHISAAAPMPLLSGLGRWSMPVTTVSRLAQQYFDQGLNLTYGFNHDEATRSFAAAFDRDSTCGMCAWGIAYSVSPNINMPMDAEAEKRGLAAIRAAQALRHTVTERERDLIDAMTLRFGDPAGEQRAARDSAYASAMRRLAEKYPTDADVQVLFADAMLNLRPWNQWTRDGEPQPGTLEVVETLERVLALTQEHAGACHFYVHAVEASPQPERALSCAERLPRLMPGAGHVVHMPAHVYMRVGMYEEAARANIAAMEADRELFAGHEVTQGIYPMFYAQHNIHFLWAAYMMSGQREKALGAARTLAERIPTDNARAAEGLEGLLVSPYLTHVRFGDWDAMLSEPAPEADLRFVKANWHYARGVAQAGRGDLLAARTELDSLRAVKAEIPAEMIIILNPAQKVLDVAERVLAARIAAASGDIDEAVDLLKTAARAEDELIYDEPSAWYEPVRQVLGTVLLNARRAAEAEAVFRDDLRYVRESGWSLAGLERALTAQGRSTEAAQISARLAKAWQDADVSPAVPLGGTRFGALQLPTGVKMRFAERGSRTGPAVVLLHGYSDSWFSFSQVLPLLPEGIRVIAPDLRGHGRSEYAGGDYSIDAMATDVAALLDRLGVVRATVVGHSMGTLVAQALAVQHPSRVERVVLAGAMRGGREPGIVELGKAIRQFDDSVTYEFMREFQLSTTHRPVDPRFIERAIAESGRLTFAAWQGIMTAMERADFMPQLGSVAVPTLLIWGDKDSFFGSESQQELLGTIPGSRLVTFENTGHAVHWEKTREFADHLVRFVAPGLAQQ